MAGGMVIGLLLTGWLNDELMKRFFGLLIFWFAVRSLWILHNHPFVKLDFPTLVRHLPS